MAPKARCDPLKIDMVDAHLAAANPAKRLRKPRKMSQDPYTAPKPIKKDYLKTEDNAEKPEAVPKSGSKPQNDKSTAVRSPSSRTNHNAARSEAVPKSGSKPKDDKLTAVTTPSSRTKRKRDLASQDVNVEEQPRKKAHTTTAPSLPAASARSMRSDATSVRSHHLTGTFEGAEAWLEAQGPDPTLTPPRGAEPKSSFTIAIKLTHRTRKAGVPPKPCHVVTAGIPLEEWTPEDLVKNVQAKRARAAAVARKRGMTINFTDRPSNRKKPTSTSLPFTSESQTTSKPSSSTTGRTLRRTAR